MRMVGIEVDVDIGAGRGSLDRHQGKEAVQGWILCARCKELLREERQG